jgi:hypothetical protein
MIVCIGNSTIWSATLYFWHGRRNERELITQILYSHSGFQTKGRSLRDAFKVTNTLRTVQSYSKLSYNNMELKKTGISRILYNLVVVIKGTVVHRTIRFRSQPKMRKSKK